MYCLSLSPISYLVIFLKSSVCNFFVTPCATHHPRSIHSLLYTLLTPTLPISPHIYSYACINLSQNVYYNNIWKWFLCLYFIVKNTCLLLSTFIESSLRNSDLWGEKELISYYVKFPPLYRLMTYNGLLTCLSHSGMVKSRWYMMKWCVTK